VSFADRIERMDLDAILGRLAGATRVDVERALAREHPGDEEIPVLFSEAAGAYLEELARRSAAVTERRFGKVIQLYTPLYLSNECVNKCTYCGFSFDNRIVRRTLSREEVLEEASFLHAEGFRHILLVSGESPRHVHLDYLLPIIRSLHESFASISIEIAPFETDAYRAIVGAGADGLTLYQETYDPGLYPRFHTKGPKHRYRHRLEGIERGADAGFRSLGIGALLGLGPWRLEATLLALHARYLVRRCWRSRVAVSFPRIRHAAGGFVPEHPVSDREVAHMLFALRILVPDAELVLSTRESPRFRDRMIGLGVTRMSAGSRTNPGGYHDPAGSEGQFEVVDRRSPVEVASAIEARGFEPVWKDFDRRFQSA
jgi:2-iminoacetate synthase